MWSVTSEIGHVGARYPRRGLVGTLRDVGLHPTRLVPGDEEHHRRAQVVRVGEGPRRPGRAGRRVQRKRAHRRRGDHRGIVDVRRGAVDQGGDSGTDISPPDTRRRSPGRVHRAHRGGGGGRDDDRGEARSARRDPTVGASWCDAPGSDRHAVVRAARGARVPRQAQRDRGAPGGDRRHGHHQEERAGPSAPPLSIAVGPGHRDRSGWRDQPHLLPFRSGVVRRNTASNSVPGSGALLSVASATRHHRTSPPGNLVSQWTQASARGTSRSRAGHAPPGRDHGRLGQGETAGGRARPVPLDGRGWRSRGVGARHRIISTWPFQSPDTPAS